MTKIEDNLQSIHNELQRLESRSGADWARDGWSLEAAQVAVDKAQSDYRSAFEAYLVSEGLVK